MLINKLDDTVKYNILLPIDDNGREINIYKLSDSIVTGKNTYYPNVLLYSLINKKIFNPINEKIMSLSDVKTEDKFILTNQEYDNIIDTPIFFFIYNTDNYFHFIYDTLPYLISFFKLKEKITDLKLLMNYPNKDKNNFYPFVNEFLNLIGVNNDDIVILNTKTLYRNLFISSSYTHGHDSNLPPRKEIYEFYKEIKNKVPTNDDLPKKIYVSRRSWIHNDTTNIGTNYTNRRKMKNENELVKYLNSIGFTEVFTEKLNTIEKIQLFSSVDDVVGAIGGGLCNVLFSKKSCNLTTIVSPTFLEVNDRFKYSLNCVNNNFFLDTHHTDKSIYKLHTRVKCGNIVGEINGKTKNRLKIIYDKSPLAGWNSDVKYDVKYVKKSECVLLDNGLNSEFIINMNKLKKIIK
jgi:capsular polysaccharide biosynthesis protein